MKRVMTYPLAFMMLCHSSFARPLSCGQVFVQPEQGEEKVFPQLLQSSLREHLNKEDKDRIKDVLNDRSLPFESQLEKILAIYLDARTREYPEAQRQEVLNEAANLTLTIADSAEKFSGNARNITAPHALLKSGVIFAVMAHEKEHRIQIYNRFKGSREVHLNEFLRFFIPLQLRIQPRFIMERDAMGAEWEILNNLSPEIISESKKQVQASAISSRNKKMLLSMLKNAELSQAEYIALQHSMGRYSKARIAVDNSVGWLFVFAVACAIFLETEEPTNE